MPGPYDGAAAAFHASEMGNRQRYADPVVFKGQSTDAVGDTSLYTTRPRAAATYQVDSEYEEDLRLKMDAKKALNADWKMDVTQDMLQYAKDQRRLKELSQKHAIVQTMFDSRRPGSYDYVNQICPEFHAGSEDQIAKDAEFAIRNHLVSYTGIRNPSDLDFVLQRNAGKFTGPVLATKRNAEDWYRAGPFASWNYLGRNKDGDYKQHILSGDPYWGSQYQDRTYSVPGELGTNRASSVFGQYDAFGNQTETVPTGFDPDRGNVNRGAMRTNAALDGNISAPTGRARAP